MRVQEEIDRDGDTERGQCNAVNAQWDVGGRERQMHPGFANADSLSVNKSSARLSAYAL